MIRENVLLVQISGVVRKMRSQLSTLKVYVLEL